MAMTSPQEIGETTERFATLFAAELAPSLVDHGSGE